HCCPARRYHFSLGPSPIDNRYLKELSDDRPFLGLLVRDVSAPETGIGSSLQVLQVGGNSVARRLLQVGDTIMNVESARPPAHPGIDPAAENSLFNKLVSLNAGETADLLVRRNGVSTRVDIKLDSMDSIIGSELIVPVDDYSINAL